MRSPGCSWMQRTECPAGKTGPASRGRVTSDLPPQLEELARQLAEALHKAQEARDKGIYITTPARFLGPDAPAS